MTKTPFRYPITGELAACKAKEGYALCSGDFEVALVNIDQAGPEASREYALSIVRAVNSHAALVEALEATEQALGENLVWLADQLDLKIRQKDAAALKRLGQMNQAWIAACVALKLAKGA